MVKARQIAPLAFSLVAMPLALASAGTLTACDGGGSGGEGGAADECFDYSAFKGDAPVASFKTDVLPIFRQSCGVSTSCHQSQSATDPAQHFLGPSKSMPDPDAMTIQAIFDGSVGVTAEKEPAMKVIDPGKPESSFLMYKLDGVKCADLKCAADNKCGTRMPQSSPQLTEAERDTIRRWIKQGAMNN